MSTVSDDKTVGYAKKALLAQIKAIEMSLGIEVSQRRWRYEIDKASGTACIKDSATGELVDGSNRPLPELAKTGRMLRRAEIALADTAINLRTLYRNSGDSSTVRYMFNVVSGEACINKEGLRLTELPDFLKQYIELKQIEFAGALISEMPDTIKAWEKIGRHLDTDFWSRLNQAREALKHAIEFGSEEGEREYTGKVAELEQAMAARKVYRLKDAGSAQ